MTGEEHLRIFVAGTRGIPDIPGGVEKHCQQLYPRIAALGHEVRIARRRPYVHDSLTSWNGVQLVDLYAPHSKIFEAIVHTFLAVFAARRWRADVIHIHAIGPSLLVPLAKLLGLRVVVTNHGPDYERAKWGGMARQILKLSEWVGPRFADEVIVISKGIGEIVRRRASRDSHLIYNGIQEPQRVDESNYLSSIGARRQNYILSLARFVPEKGLHDLVEAFRRVSTDWHLVLAGDADHEDEYSRNLKDLATQDPRVILTGYVTGKRLSELLTYAGLFVLPSYHEGLSIALLEAMSYGLPCLISDIKPNLEVDLPVKCYFKTGNVADLRIQLDKHIVGVLTREEKEAIQSMIKNRFDWNRIATDTIEVYRNAI